jgi:hypothetical protein
MAYIMTGTGWKPLLPPMKPTVDEGKWWRGSLAHLHANNPVVEKDLEAYWTKDTVNGKAIGRTE